MGDPGCGRGRRGIRYARVRTAGSPSSANGRWGPPNGGRGAGGSRVRVRAGRSAARSSGSGEPRGRARRRAVCVGSSCSALLRGLARSGRTGESAARPDEWRGWVPARRKPPERAGRFLGRRTHIQDAPASRGASLGMTVPRSLQPNRRRASFSGSGTPSRRPSIPRSSGGRRGQTKTATNLPLPSLPFGLRSLPRCRAGGSGRSWNRIALLAAPFPPASRVHRAHRGGGPGGEHERGRGPPTAAVRTRLTDT
jgi:hypothetical protein